MSEANLRRRIVGLERRMSEAWRMWVYGWMLVTVAAAFLVLSFMCWAGVVAAVTR